MLYEKVERDSKDIVFVYTTCGGLEEAREIGLSAIEEKLAISCDYWIVNSIYPWKSVIQEIDQYMLMFATEEVLSPQLIKHIESNHSYDTPMIVRCPISMTNKSYAFWVDTTLSGKDKYITEAEAIAKKNKENEFHIEKLK